MSGHESLIHLFLLIKYLLILFFNIAWFGGGIYLLLKLL